MNLLPPDQTVALLREGYQFLGHRRPPGTDVYEVRVLGEKATCVVGPEAAELFYELARRQREVWLAELVEQLRRDELVAEADSPVAVVAGHRDFDGEWLDPRTAAVELLNLLRPIAAVAWYVAFAAHAPHVHPHWRDRIPTRPRSGVVLCDVRPVTAPRPS